MISCARYKCVVLCRSLGMTKNERASDVEVMWNTDDDDDYYYTSRTRNEIIVPVKNGDTSDVGIFDLQENVNGCELLLNSGGYLLYKTLFLQISTEIYTFTQRTAFFPLAVCVWACVTFFFTMKCRQDRYTIGIIGVDMQTITT